MAGLSARLARRVNDTAPLVQDFPHIRIIKGRNKPTFAATNSLRKHDPLAWQADIARSLQVF